ncbi:MAG: hypothetical protein K0Q70_1040, partial [Rhodospirillales bacterium]|nr:hypothetical protein [Rhodospirillales bacterium]
MGSDGISRKNELSLVYAAESLAYRDTASATSFAVSNSLGISADPQSAQAEVSSEGFVTITAADPGIFYSAHLRATSGAVDRTPSDLLRAQISDLPPGARRDAASAEAEAAFLAASSPSDQTLDALIDSEGLDIGQPSPPTPQALLTALQAASIAVYAEMIVAQSSHAASPFDGETASASAMSSAADTGSAADAPLAGMFAIAPAYVPSDPLFGQQWQLNPTFRYDLHLSRAWDDYRGTGVKVGLIDDGVDYLHSDIAPNYRSDLDWDSYSNDGDPYYTSGNYHGTATTGLIVGAINGSGIVGVAPGAKASMLGINFDYGTTTQLIGQLNRMTSFDVVNNSWGFTDPFADNRASSSWNSMFQELRDAVTLGRGGLGTIVVFAAGNARTAGDNTNYHGMQNAIETITVAAANADGTIAYFSTPGSSVLVTAPGVSTYTTDVRGATGYSSSDYTTFSGTSAA